MTPRDRYIFTPRREFNDLLAETEPYSASSTVKQHSKNHDLKVLTRKEHFKRGQNTSVELMDYLIQQKVEPALKAEGKLRHINGSLLKASDIIHNVNVMKQTN